MSINSYFENGVVDYFRSLFEIDGMFHVEQFTLFRIGDLYYSFNSKDLLIGIKKELHTKDDKVLVGDVFSYHDCRTMERFKYVKKDTDSKTRRLYGKTRCIYSFLNDTSRNGLMLWAGGAEDFYMNYIRSGLPKEITIYTSGDLFKLFGGLGFLCGNGNNYTVTVEEFYYGNERWLRLSCIYWVVCICVDKKCKSIDRIYSDYKIGLNWRDFEHHTKKDILFKGLRINA